MPGNTSRGSSKNRGGRNRRAPGSKAREAAAKKEEERRKKLEAEADKRIDQVLEALGKITDEAVQGSKEKLLRDLYPFWERVRRGGARRSTAAGRKAAIEEGDAEDSEKALGSVLGALNPDSLAKDPKPPAKKRRR